MSHARFTLSLFSPGEAERITGLSTVMQRDWRRRKLLPEPAGPGHARFNAFDLASMWTRRLLSDRGIGPQETEEIGRWCAFGIIWHALMWIDSWEGDHEKFEAPTWPLKAQAMARKVIFAENGGFRVLPARFFIWWADGSHMWHQSVDAAFNADESSDPKYTGPVIVLDLMSLGFELVDRVNRPIVHVEFSEDTSE